MKLSHLLIAGATAVSFSAVAAEEQKQQPSQSGQQSSSQAQSGQKQQLSQETVKQVQQKLSDAGHKLEVDGIMGPKTQAALREYQQEKGLQASGRLDQKTMASLGVEEGASASVGGTAGASGGQSGEKSEKSEKSEQKQ